MVIPGDFFHVNLPETKNHVMKSLLFSSHFRLNTLILCSVVIIISLSVNTYGQHTIDILESDGVKILTLKSGLNNVATIPSSLPKPINTGNSSPVESTKGVLPNPNWTLKFSAPGKVFKDISFVDGQIGYIVTELGSVYKSTNGGENWSSVMNLGFPYYWYGVDALSPDTVVISGFNNQAAITNGVVRWTFDGGATWSPDINLTIPVSAVGWLDRVHFFNADTGIVINSFSGGCWYTHNGGKDASSWTYVTINPDLAWFAGNIDAQASGLVYATGIHLGKSADFGYSWTSGPCADVVFDGGIDFLDLDNSFGWTGGGQISAPVAGWICRTTDGGLSWSSRLNTFPYPIRALQFLDVSTGWAVGGNLYDEAGGIYGTTDGGLTWTQEISTSAEMFSIECKTATSDSTDFWCVGSTGGGTGYTGKLYKARIGVTSTGLHQFPFSDNPGITLFQNHPNPFSQLTSIEFTIPFSGKTTLKVFDIFGKEVAILLDGFESSGSKSVQFDGSSLPSGIYYYQLNSGNYHVTKKMMVSHQTAE